MRFLRLGAKGLARGLETANIGKNRWPQVEAQILDLASRGLEVYFLHKPLSDEAWRKGDPKFGRTVLRRLESVGIHLIPIQGVHAKTIVIDGELVYDGSLNWASQTDSYEHMWRWRSRDLAQLVYQKLQLEYVLPEFSRQQPRCPNCSGPVVVLNQKERGAYYERQPLAFACANRMSKDTETRCEKGYIRGVHRRAPLSSPPQCSQGEEMSLQYNKNGQPWRWLCQHGSCEHPRWRKGDTTQARKA